MGIQYLEQNRRHLNPEQRARRKPEDPVAGACSRLTHQSPLAALARGKFKEICEPPNGSCQEFCLEKEVHAGQCLNDLTCCLPVGNEPFIEPTTPKER
ncbi:beta-defensin 108B [Prionailurus bengalensis]|uniref:beta-defensin 108B n=1 Tax=Prionailurus bengalensis TaxID=37029 RepID=UPI001CA896BA|nr:beta-defensin 108B [Prionailurus bengalensis]